MDKINFITSNEGKANTFRTSLEIYGLDIEVVTKNLDIIEPQLDNIAEISMHKALEAYKILGEPLIVEDGGMCIKELNGFPGPYTKFATATIGANGIMKLMDRVDDRSAHFESVTTYVDKDGNAFQFMRDGFDFEIVKKIVDINSPYAWSELWKIIYFKQYGKTLCEFSKEELNKYFEESGKNGSLQKFAKWFAENQ